MGSEMCIRDRLKVVDFVHFGTPCSSFSQARQDDGGPPPIRSEEHIRGLPGLSAADQAKVELGNALAEITLALISKLTLQQLWSIENPAHSYLWKLPAMMDLANTQGVLRVEFHMCQYGHRSRKLTAVLTNCGALAGLHRLCSGSWQRCNCTGQSHQALKGQVWDPASGRKQWQTKLAQVYPEKLCDLWAQLAMEQRASDVGLPGLASSFMLVTPPGERNRPVGLPSKLGKQTEWAANAVLAGHQTKKGRVQPLLEVELEPGQATWVAMAVTHPFTRPIKLEPEEERLFGQMEGDLPGLKAQRERALVHWQARAEALRKATCRELPQVAMSRILDRPELP